MTQRRSKQQWLDLVGQQEQSGLSMAEFCREKNINPKRFYYHSRKREISATIADDNNSPPFVRARIINDSTASDNRSSQSIRLTYKQSDIILPATLSPGWLAALLAALP